MSRNNTHSNSVYLLDNFQENLIIPLTETKTSNLSKDEQNIDEINFNLIKLTRKKPKPVSPNYSYFPYIFY